MEYKNNVLDSVMIDYFNNTLYFEFVFFMGVVYCFIGTRVDNISGEINVVDVIVKIVKLKKPLLIIEYKLNRF